MGAYYPKKMVLIMQGQIHVAKVIETSRLGFVQLMVLAQCFLCMVVDGFDIQAMAYVAPQIVQQLGVDKASLGPVFSAGLLGMLIGSVSMGMVADRIGRRPVLIMSLIVISAGMYATTWAGTVSGLIACRLVTGLAMGALVPNVAALAIEFSPSKARVTALMLASSGMAIGGICGGVFAAALIPLYGWKVIFYIGASGPLLVAFIMLLVLPESLQWSVLNGKRLDHVRATLRRIDPALEVTEESLLLSDDLPHDKGLFRRLFAPGTATGTALLWLINFANMLCVYFLASWMPLLMTRAGHSESEAVLAATFMWTGGLVGTWILGWVVDRYGFKTILVPLFAATTVAIVVFSFTHTWLYLSYVLIACVGLGILGGQAALNAMASSFYPTSLRSTGMGWALGLGRLGGILGPILGGVTLQLQWSTRVLFLLSAIPVAIVTLAILVFCLGTQHRRTPVMPALGEF
jgi:AAHS family 4-hydroxybenzoate transporter-like MFS transporter